MSTKNITNLCLLFRLMCYTISTNLIIERLISMPETTRVRRSKEERIAIIDSKIAKSKANIEILETKKSIILKA